MFRWVFVAHHQGICCPYFKHRLMAIR